MTWVRCPECGTVGDPDRSSRCFGCGAILNPETEGARAPAHHLQAPEVETKARKDLRRSTVALAGIGFMGLLSVATSAGSGLPAWFRLPLFLALVASAAAWIILARRSPGTAVDSAGRVAISLLAGAGILVLVGLALCFALVIFLIVVCSQQK